MYSVYIIYSENIDKFYVGQTQDFSQRIERHNGGMVTSTKKTNDWKLIWKTEVNSRSEALILERKIKNKGARRFLTNIGM